MPAGQRNGYPVIIASSMINLRSVKIQLIIFLIAFALFLAIKDQDGLFLLATGIAVVSAVAAEAGFLFFSTRSWQITQSSVISGLIIGFVLSRDQPWWIFACAGLLAIISKRLIRRQKKHIFNPAACGIFLTMILFGAQTQWKGTYLWYILAVGGVYFAYKVRKTEVVVAYAAVALSLFAAQAYIQRVDLRNIFGYLSYFYIFIMVIEPKTTPLNPPGKYIFGGAVAVFIFILTQAGARFDVELASLLGLNACVLLLNKIRLKGGAV
jgi:Na+-translocating ferredoxin:NAD+ oxidoreductase RnfD subunit